MDHGRYDEESGKHHERHQRPFGWRSRPAFGVAILVPPAVAVAVPQTSAHDRLLTAFRTVRRIPILLLGELAAIDAT